MNKEKDNVIPLYNYDAKTSNYSQYMSNPDNLRRVAGREALIFGGFGAALGYVVAKKIGINPLIGLVAGAPILYYGIYALHNRAWKKNNSDNNKTK